MVNLNWQLDWIYNHHGNPPVGVSVVMFPEDFTEKGRPSPNKGSPILWVGVPDGIKGKK